MTKQPSPGDTRLLVCDLDNTLYDWVGFFVPAFYAMVDKVVEITACDREALLDDFRAVHQRHHDSEHPFALLETGFVSRDLGHLSIEERKRLLDPAFHAFNSVRRDVLRVHPGVHETLENLTRLGVKLVAHTESKVQAIAKRLEMLNLTDYFARVYCRERSISEHLGLGVRDDFMQRVEIGNFVELTHHQRKPNADVLLEICAAESTGISQAAYVGDSIARDVLMAKEANVYAIWAAYGAHHDSAEYEKLVRITHWTADDVARERELKEAASQVSPDFVATESFTQVLDALRRGA